MLGLTSAPRSGDIRAAYDPVSDSTLATYAPTGVMLQPHDGVNMVTGMMYIAKRPPSALAYLELDLLVQSPKPRSPDERQLVFRLDDTTRLKVGLAGAFAAPAFGGRGAVEHIVAMIPPDQALTLLRAEAVRGLLGSTVFQFSRRDRDGLRALALYARCGSQ